MAGVWAVVVIGNAVHLQRLQNLTDEVRELIMGVTVVISTPLARRSSIMFVAGGIAAAGSWPVALSLLSRTNPAWCKQLQIVPSVTAFQASDGMLMAKSTSTT